MRIARRFFCAPQAVFLALLLLAICLQRSSGAHQTAFVGYPDEPAHYVTGLLVRDYLAQGMPTGPFEYATDYYMHYPKVAFGQWPPVFYALEGAWRLLTSPSRASILILMAIIATTMAFLVYTLLAAEFGKLIAFICAGLVIANPAIQWVTSRAMADNLAGLLIFAAMLAWGRFLDNERWRDVLWFGFLSAAAVMTKGNGFILALSAPLALLLTKRFRLVMTAKIWSAAAIVALVSVPWYLFTFRSVSSTWNAEVGLSYALRALGAHAQLFVRDLGFPVLLLAVVGVFALRLGSTGQVQRNGVWAAVIALIPAWLVFTCAVPAVLEPRIMTPCIPAVISLAGAGAAGMVALFSENRRSVAQAAIYTAVPLLFGWLTFYVPQKPASAFPQVAADLMARNEFDESIILVSSNSVDEGALIAEIAMREQNRPERLILRGFKILSDSDWLGISYKLRYSSEEDLAERLRSIPVGLLVLTDGGSEVQVTHQKDLLALVRAQPAEWKLEGAYGSGGTSASTKQILVYSMKNHQSLPRGRIHMEIGRWGLEINK